MSASTSAAAERRPLDDLQQAFLETGGAQCGICTPGMVLAALSVGETPTLDEIRTALAGNLCRCTGYVNIVAAVGRAAELLRESAADPTSTRGGVQ